MFVCEYVDGTKVPFATVWTKSLCSGLAKVVFKSSVWSSMCYDCCVWFLKTIQVVVIIVVDFCFQMIVFK